MQSIEPDSFANDVEGTRDKVRWHKLITQTVYDFAENTTLNGLKYMAEKGSSIFERLFWISTFILSTVLCVLMVYKSYEKYDTSGVVVTLKEHLVSVNEYPFPAVTICPEARIRKSKYNYTKEGISLTINGEDRSGLELKKFHSVFVLCDNDEGIDSTSQLSFLNYSVDIRHPYTIDPSPTVNSIWLVLREVAPKHEDIFKECSWRNKVDCMKSFRPVLTADGICYTFNILATDEIFRKKSVYQKRYYLNTSTPQKGWSLEKNYYNLDRNSFPRRGRANGAREDLYIVLKEITDRDFACDRQTRPGYKVYLHHPADIPQASLHSYAAQPGKTTSFAIKLDILDTAEELMSYPPQIRQCYYPNEKYLQFFQNYTSVNCQLECLTNYTLQICGCANFYMPRNESIPICKADQYNCIEKVLDQYANEEDLNDRTSKSCKCLPSCNDVNYDAEIILTKLDLKEYFKRAKELDKLVEDEYDSINYEDHDEDSYEPEANSIDIDRSNKTDTQSDVEYESDDENTANETEDKFTEIRMYYRRPSFVAMERSELVGLSQFLADVGGTLGLFLGFSFLTLAEIFYFFTLKLCCKYRQETIKREDKLNAMNDVLCSK